MKKSTLQYIYFIISTIVIMSICRISMSYFLSNYHYTLVYGVAALWFMAMYIAGWYFGKKEFEELPLYAAGLKYHLATYSIFMEISYIWFIYGEKSKYENLYQVNMTLGIWGFFLLLHIILYFYNKPKSIKGLEKGEIFE